MKARVKATGEIVNVKIFDKYFDYNGRQWIIYEDEKSRTFNEKHLDFDLDNSPEDYWDKLLHQYAGMAMQGILACENWKITPREGVSFEGEVALQAHELAHALVEKLKEEQRHE